MKAEFRYSSYLTEKSVYTDDTQKKKRELLKNPTKIDEIQEKKIIDRN